jgi:hypothetical protein
MRQTRPRQRCPGRAGKTLAHSRQARVWYTGDPDAEDRGASYFGCLKSNGRVRKLAETNGCFHECDGVGLARLEGHYLAWDYSTSFSYGGGAPSSSSDSVQVFDLRSGKRVSSAVFSSSQYDGTTTVVSGGPLASLLLAPHGTAVLLYGTNPSFTLGDVPRGAEEASSIDSGAIDPASLTIDGEVLSWTNAGQARMLSLAS